MTGKILARNGQVNKRRCLGPDPEGQELRAVARTADAKRQILASVQQIRHRRARLWRWHINGTDFLPGGLVVRAQHGTAAIWRRGESAFTGNHERLVTSWPIRP